IEEMTDAELKEKTLVRGFDRYIMGDDSQPSLSHDNLNNAAKYLGYENFGDFCRNYFPEMGTERGNKSNNSNQKKSKLYKGLIGIGTATVLGIGAITFNGLDNSQCMYWEKTHYTQIDCDKKLHPETPVLAYDEQLAKYFLKIEPADTTSFFKAGKAAVWYSKTDGEIEFFSAPGNHPINGKELKPVTKYIVRKYVLER